MADKATDAKPGAAPGAKLAGALKRAAESRTAAQEAAKALYATKDTSKPPEAPK